MASKCEGKTTSDLRSVQREKERERRRMRDRQRRQNMSLEQRERHLARRRRNYQLRRMRAENSKLGDQQNQNLTPAESQENAVNRTVYNASGADLPFCGLQIKEKSVSSIDWGESGIQRQRRLRMHQIRHLARLLHTPANDNQITVGDANPSENCSGGGGMKRLRLTHIKRLARALKSDMNSDLLCGSFGDEYD